MLSGGERNRLQLAMTLREGGNVLLLDEPTSDMDTGTERRVVERLAKHLDGRTLVAVTHRPAMLDIVDRLIVIDGGKARLDGPKADVIAALADARATADETQAPRSGAA
ncbi:MAG: ATP-binding cassette domain-containing protein [Pseudomonadota bacterium]